MYSFALQEHGSRIMNALVCLMKGNSLVDCILAAEGKHLRAHKVILSACSPYFQMLFNEEKEKNPIVILKGIKFEDLKYIIEFIYCGETKVPEDHIQSFCSSAELLQITGLADLTDKDIPECEQRSSSSFGHNIVRSVSPGSLRHKSSKLKNSSECSSESIISTLSKNKSCNSSTFEKANNEGATIPEKALGQNVEDDIILGEAENAKDKKIVSEAEKTCTGKSELSADGNGASVGGTILSKIGKLQDGDEGISNKKQAPQSIDHIMPQVIFTCNKDQKVNTGNLMVARNGVCKDSVCALSSNVSKDDDIIANINYKNIDSDLDVEFCNAKTSASPINSEKENLITPNSRGIKIVPSERVGSPLQKTEAFISVSTSKGNDVTKSSTATVSAASEKVGSPLQKSEKFLSIPSSKENDVTNCSTSRVSDIKKKLKITTESETKEKSKEGNESDYDIQTVYSPQGAKRRKQTLCPFVEEPNLCKITLMDDEKEKIKMLTEKLDLSKNSGDLTSRRKELLRSIIDNEVSAIMKNVTAKEKNVTSNCVKDTPVVSKQKCEAGPSSAGKEEEEEAEKKKRPQRFLCKLCEAVFRNCTELKHHQCKFAYACWECSDRFKTKSALSSHLVKHGKRAKLRTCGQCGEVFALKSQLTSHMQTHVAQQLHK